MKKISGVGKWHILKNFFKRFNDPYDLRIRNAIDGEEMLHIALTKKSVFMLISSLLVLSFLIVSLLFLFTPIKYYIPGFETRDSRKKIIALRGRIDSLETFQRGYRLILDNAFAVAQDNEVVLLDTIGLSQGQLTLAEMANQNEIASNRGKRRVVGKRPQPIDTAKNKGIKTSESKNKVKITDEVAKKEVAKKEVTKKKRDTVIIYRKRQP